MLTVAGATSTGCPPSSFASTLKTLPRLGRSSAPTAKPPSASTSTHCDDHAGTTTPGVFELVSRTSRIFATFGGFFGSMTVPTTNGNRSVETGGALMLSCFAPAFDPTPNVAAAPADPAPL